MRGPDAFFFEKQRANMNEKSVSQLLVRKIKLNNVS